MLLIGNLVFPSDSKYHFPGLIRSLKSENRHCPISIMPSLHSLRRFHHHLSVRWTALF